jgi:RNA polymerase sigma factor (sigma-70 family)
MTREKDAEFTNWLNPRQKMFIKIARGICFDTQIAEDILQDAMADIYARWEKIKNHENLDAYAIRVMMSKHIDSRRKIRRSRHDRDLPLESAFEIATIASNQEELVEVLMVQNAIKSLSPEQRTVLQMHYEFGFLLREISEILEIPIGTVASHLARGKASVATYLNFLPEILHKDKEEITVRKVKEISNKPGEVKE